VNTLRSSRQKTPRGARSRRSAPYVVTSLGLHLLAGIMLVQFLISPMAFMLIFGERKTPPVPVERIGFLRLPVAKGPPVVGQSGGNNRPVTKTPPVKLVAPMTIPNTLPPVSVSQKPTGEEGSGPLVGTGGPARGIKPSYTGPRLWPAPGDIVAAPKTPTQRLDSVIATLIQPYNDSMAIINGQRKPGDWTIERDGKKYGIDQQYIHLGKYSIPTAILGLLPINAQANPILAESNRTMNQLHSDIMSQAQRGMNEADFRKAVKSIRERKERERAAASGGASGGSDNKKRPAEPPPAVQGPPDRS
jgi:hypothetical protein